MSTNTNKINTLLRKNLWRYINLKKIIGIDYKNTYPKYIWPIVNMKWEGQMGQCARGLRAFAVAGADQTHQSGLRR